MKKILFTFFALILAAQVFAGGTAYVSPQGVARDTNAVSLTFTFTPFVSDGWLNGKVSMLVPEGFNPEPLTITPYSGQITAVIMRSGTTAEPVPASNIVTDGRAVTITALTFGANDYLNITYGLVDTGNYVWGLNTPMTQGDYVFYMHESPSGNTFLPLLAPPKITVNSLKLIKSAAASTAYAGLTFTYTLTVSNLSAIHPLDTISVWDSLPPGIKPIGSNIPFSTQSLTFVSWNIINILSTGNTAIQLYCEVQAGIRKHGASAVNVAGAYAKDMYLNEYRSTAEAALITSGPVLNAYITAVPDAVVYGQKITVVMKVSNTGNASAYTVSPASSFGTAGTAAAQLVTGPVPTVQTLLAAGGTAYFTWVYQALQAGTVSFTGKANATEGDKPITTGLANSNQVTVLAPTATPSATETQAPAITSVLETSCSYGVLSSTFTRYGGLSAVSGDVGYTTLSGGGAHTAGGTTTVPAPPQAGLDQAVALVSLNNQACSFVFAIGAIDLESDTTHGITGVYTPGVYCVDGAMSIGGGGIITLNGKGTYIFRSTGALTSSDNSKVLLTGGAEASDVFWTPGEAVTLGANTEFVGTVIDDAGITVGNTTSWTGRVLAFGGTVTLDTDSITVPACAAAGTPTETPSIVPSVSATVTADASSTVSPSVTNTPVDTATSTPTATSSVTASYTDTFTKTATGTATETSAVTYTPTFTFTRTNTPTVTETSTLPPTATYTATRTNTPTKTETFTPLPSSSATASVSHSGTYTNTPTNTLPNTVTETYTITPTFTITTTYTASPTPDIIARFDKNYFNPDKGETLQIGSMAGVNVKIKIKVYNLTGEMVRKYEYTTATAGWNFYTWDGKNDKGKMFGRGLYFVHITREDGREEVKRVYILK